MSLCWRCVRVAVQACMAGGTWRGHGPEIVLRSCGDRSTHPGETVAQGTTMKINLALSDYPRFTCLPERIGQHRTTIHLLPQARRSLSCTDTQRPRHRHRLAASHPPPSRCVNIAGEHHCEPEERVR